MLKLNSEKLENPRKLDFWKFMRFLMFGSIWDEKDNLSQISFMRGDFTRGHKPPMWLFAPWLSEYLPFLTVKTACKVLWIYAIDLNCHVLLFFWCFRYIKHWEQMAHKTSGWICVPYPRPVSQYQTHADQRALPSASGWRSTLALKALGFCRL